MAHLYRVILTAFLFILSSSAQALIPTTGSCLSGGMQGITGGTLGCFAFVDHLAPAAGHLTAYSTFQQWCPGYLAVPHPTDANTCWRPEAIPGVSPAGWSLTIRYWEWGPTQVCSANSTASGGSCACSAGYVQNAANTACVLPSTCPANSTGTSPACTCNASFKMVGGACVPQTECEMQVDRNFTKDLGWIKNGKTWSGSWTTQICDPIPSGGGCVFNTSPTGAAPTGQPVNGSVKWQAEYEGHTAGTTCTPGPDAPMPPPECLGSQGSVNGVTVCVPEESEAEKAGRAAAAGAAAASAASKKLLQDGATPETAALGAAAASSAAHGYIMSGGSTAGAAAAGAAAAAGVGATAAGAAGAAASAAAAGGNAGAQAAASAAYSAAMNAGQSQTQAQAAAAAATNVMLAGGTAAEAAAAGAAGAGYSGGGGSGTEQSDYCQLNPTAEVCQSQGTFSGSCGAPPACTGDAVMCAIAAATFTTNCTLATSAGPETAKYAAAAAQTPAQIQAGLSGGSFAINSAAFSQTELLGAASCIADRSVTVGGHSVTLAFSMVCAYLLQLGQILVSVSLLLAARIVFRG